MYVYITMRQELVIYECANKSQQEDLEVLQQLFCRLGHQFAFPCGGNAGSFSRAAGARVPKWREHWHHAETSLSHIYMPVEVRRASARSASAVSPSPSAAALLFDVLYIDSDFVINLAGFDRRSRKLSPGRGSVTILLPTPILGLFRVPGKGKSRVLLSSRAPSSNRSHSAPRFHPGECLFFFFGRETSVMGHK
jgi:hypothetical protein